jgi:hypothetical protein
MCAPLAKEACSAVKWLHGVDESDSLLASVHHVRRPDAGWRVSEPEITRLKCQAIDVSHVQV